MQITNKDDFNAIKISDLSGEIYVDNIELTTILGDYEDNSNLYNILLEASGKEANKQNAELLTASALNNFDLTKVKLSTALTDNTGNKILETLRADETVTLGNIGTKLNEVSLYEIFGEDCFTQDASKTNDTSYKFKKVTVAGKIKFVHDDANGTYYINKTAGIWLLLCFDSNNLNSTGENAGRAEEYEISTKTLANLIDSNSGDVNFVSNVLEKATLRQLMDAGMVSDVNAKIYNYTLSDLIKLIDNIPSNILDALLNK